MSGRGKSARVQITAMVVSLGVSGEDCRSSESPALSACTQ